MAVGIRAIRVAGLVMAIGAAGLAGGDASSGAVIMPPPVDPMRWVDVCDMRVTDDSAPQPESVSQPQSVSQPESASFDDWQAVAEPGAWTIGLLTLGQFHADEVSARTGDVWLGLFPTASGFALRPATLKIAPWDDPIVEGGGKEVTVKEAEKPLFLVNAGSRLHARAVPTAFAGDVSLGNGTSVSLAWRGVEHRLSVVSGDSTRSFGVEHPDSRLTLSSDSPGPFSYQTLVRTKTPNGEPWRLLWAGDLDGDGKLDLLVEVSSHDNVDDHRLFLSTAASKGQAVGQAAVFMNVGC